VSFANKNSQIAAKYSVAEYQIKGVDDLKHSKGVNAASSTGAVDEGRNETTRIPYTDSISAPASDNIQKKHKKNKKK